MPVKQCFRDGKPGYKYGDSGHCYTYSPGDSSGKSTAKSKAKAQGRAIEANRKTLSKK